MVWCVLVSPAFAQTESANTEPPITTAAGADSPRAVMQTFLQAMERYEESSAISVARTDAIATLRRCMDLSSSGRDAAEHAAIELLGVLNRIGRIDSTELPGAAAIDELGVSEFVFFPDRADPAHRELLEGGADGQIVLARDTSGAWRFSASTVAGVGRLYNSVAHLDVKFGADERTLSTTLWLRSQMPDSLRAKKFMGVELWQWIGLLLIAFIGVAIDVVTQLMLRGRVARRIARGGDEVDADVLRRAVRPFGLFAGALIALLMLRLLGLPVVVQQVVFTAVRLVLMIAGVMAAFRVVDVLTDVLGTRAMNTHTKIDDLLVPLVRKTLKIFIFALGLIYIADSLNIEILPLLTGLGIGGLAVAFAAKDTIENFFGSVAVIFDRPFEVGDWVVIDAVEGTVEELGFRSTRVRTFYNSLITIPNATLVRATVDNYGRRKYRRYMTNLGVAYDTPPEKIDAFCEGIRELIRQHPYTRKDYYQVYFTGYADSALTILLYVFFQAPDWSVELRERHRLLADILRLAAKIGVEFAYPTQTLHLKRAGESLAEQAPDTSAVDDTERASAAVGRRAARSLTRNAAWRSNVPGEVEFKGADPHDEDDEDTQVEQRTAGG